METPSCAGGKSSNVTGCPGPRLTSPSPLPRGELTNGFPKEPKTNKPDIWIFPHMVGGGGGRKGILGFCLFCFKSPRSVEERYVECIPERRGVQADADCTQGYQDAIRTGGTATGCLIWAKALWLSLRFLSCKRRSFLGLIQISSLRKDFC